MNGVIELKHVNKTIRGKKIIDDLSFSVEKGEVFGFLGPNGAGKTTTIRMIAGLIRMTSGQIYVCQKSIRRQYEEAIRHIGAIVENPELYKFLTGYENLRQAARLMKGVTEEKIAEVINLVGLEERIHDKVRTYSLGMRQRLGIAQSLLHDPKVLILDEPTNGLDPAGIREVRDYLRILAREKGLAIIVSSHLLSEMEMMCDRIAIIQKGKLIHIQNVHTEGETDVKTYLCDVNDKVRAKHLLTENKIHATVHAEGIQLILETCQVPDVLRFLLDHDILVFEMKVVRKSLEDRFLEITNEEEVLAHGSVDLQ